jgi:hypothetical protein
MMKNKKQLLFFLVMFTLFLTFVFQTFSYAETYVTGKVSLTKSALSYNRLSKTSYLDVSLKSITSDVLLTPIKVVIESISDSGVKVANADGTTATGKPYFSYTTLTGQLLSNQSSPAKKWVFSNPKAARFTYTYSVQATLPEAVGVIGSEGGTVEVADPASPIYGAKVVIPDNSLPTGGVGTILTIQEDNSGVQLPSENFESVTTGVRITSSTPLNRYVKVMLPLKGRALQSDSIVVSHYDDVNNTWSTLPVSFIDYQKNTIEFFTPGFSIFQGIKFRGLPPSDQLNMDVFMRYQYPLLLNQIRNAEFMIDATSDFEYEHTAYINNAVDVATTIVNAANLSKLGSGDAAEYANQVVDLLSQSLGVLYSEAGSDSKQWINPIMDADKCILEGTIKSIINHTPPQLEILESCGLDTVKNAYLGFISFYGSLALTGDILRINEANMTIDYLQLSYSTGGNLTKMANYANAVAPTEDEIIAAIGKAYYKRGWFSWDDYRVFRVKQMVSDMKADVARVRQAEDPDNDFIPGTTGRPWKDNCPAVFNPDQTDSDGDGVGDACHSSHSGPVSHRGCFTLCNSSFMDGINRQCRGGQL